VGTAGAGVLGNDGDPRIAKAGLIFVMGHIAFVVVAVVLFSGG
jgi:hypothetical protein